MKKNTRISIISAVYNAEETIGRMIESVIDQTYENLELIIIDGGSLDRTVQIIKHYGEYIDFWVSESDRGIYHAMNKGARKATGDYLYFLNGDDWLHHSEVFQKVSQKIDQQKYDLIYGNVVRVYPDFEVEISRGFSLSLLKRGKIPPHQASLLSKASFCSLDGYREKFQSAGDLDLYCRFEKTAQTTKYVNIPFAYVRSGGVSSQKEISTPEVFHVIKSYFGIFPAVRFQIRMIFEKLLKSVLQQLGMESIYKKMLKYILTKNI
jgi:glycosyltransferase involved in cell wall biosynthesis